MMPHNIFQHITARKKNALKTGTVREKGSQKKKKRMESQKIRLKSDLSHCDCNVNDFGTFVEYSDKSFVFNSLKMQPFDRIYIEFSELKRQSIIEFTLWNIISHCSELHLKEQKCTKRVLLKTGPRKS